MHEWGLVNLPELATELAPNIPLLIKKNETHELLDSAPKILHN